jgi:hypothetical protein
LPKGKLEAITKLMVREDVPVFVTPGEDKIEVHGTARQHMIFDAFCAMIRGEEGEKAFEMPEGRLEALTELMIREDVPVLVSPGDGDITVHGNELQHMVFGAFVKMITSEEKPRAATALGYSTGVADAPTLKHVVEGEVDYTVSMPTVKAYADIAKQYEKKAMTQVAELERLHDVLARLEKQYRAQERLYEKIWQRAEEMEEEADRIEEKADEIEASTDELEGEALLAAMEKVNKLMLKAQQIENEARMLEAQAEAAEARADAIEAEAEAVEQRIAELEDKIEDLEEKIEEQKQSEPPKD